MVGCTQRFAPRFAPGPNVRPHRAAQCGKRPDQRPEGHSAPVSGRSFESLSGLTGPRESQEPPLRSSRAKPPQAAITLTGADAETPKSDASAPPSQQAGLLAGASLPIHLATTRGDRHGDHARRLDQTVRAKIRKRGIDLLLAVPEVQDQARGIVRALGTSEEREDVTSHPLRVRAGASDRRPGRQRQRGKRCRAGHAAKTGNQHGR